MKQKRKKNPESAEPDPAQKMIDFTRRLLNVSKSEVDAVRKKQATKKKRYGLPVSFFQVSRMPDTCESRYVNRSASSMVRLLNRMTCSST